MSVKTVRLAATNKSEAIAEREGLRAATREKRVTLVADRRVRVRDVVDDYIQHLRDLAGTEAQMSPRHIANIETKLRLYVLPKIGHMKLTAVEAEDILALARAAKKRSPPSTP